jgi:hypothetical protein
MIRVTIQTALCLCLSPLLVAQQPTVPQSTPTNSWGQHDPSGKHRFVRIPKDFPVILRLERELSSGTPTRAIPWR